MTISRDVVLDLLPLYLANEASEDSRKLIDAYLQANPEFTQWLKEHQATLLPPELASPSAQLEKETFVNFTRHQRKRSFLLALSIFLTAMPFSFMFDSDNGLLWWMIKDSPSQAYSFLFLALCAWVGYLWTDRDKAKSQ